MQGYDRDDYEDLDEYEEDGEEQEEDGIGEGEYEEEEAPQTTQEELEYLELRQRLKEAIRKQIKKESGSGHANSQEKKKKLPYDNYGSFFGPSQPVIAQRVIQESKSLLENHHLAPKVSKSNHDVGTIKSKSLASTTAGSKTQARNHHPKVVNQLKTKVQKLKDTRDYSFLLSDDAELPAPTKDPPIRNVSVPNSEARSAQVPPKSRQWSTNTGRLVPNSREERKPMSTGSQTHPKTGPRKLISAGKPIPTSVDSRKQLGNNNGSGPGRPLGPKGLPSKMPAATTERRVAAPQRQSLDQKPSVHRPPSSKLHSSAPKQASVPKQSLDQKKEAQGSSRGKMMPKQPVPSSKPQINKQPAKIPSCPPLREDRPKKKPVRPYDDDDVDDDDDEGGRAISMIRSMFRYNPRKFADEDDDSDMEANYEDIMREEQRSARIARKEDEEELRKIEEEERRERLRKEAKKRKLSQR
ncbi:hypothetical protein CsSME_00015134 [Camellia sinensis var. sinensis]